MFILSPHASGFSTQDLLDLRIKTFSDDLARYIKGEKLHCLVNKELGY
jgi:hypothetical protein